MDDKRVEYLEEELDLLRKEFRTYVEEKRKEESQRLRTALLVSGGVISALGSFIWIEMILPIIHRGK